MDVGAYKGFYSLLASQFVHDGYVIAVEPDPDAFKFLLKSIELNGIRNIIALNVALSDSINVMQRTRTIDDLLGELDLIPQVIKIDVEGAEYSVLRGAKKLLTNHKPVLLIEVHANADFEIFDYLVELGYNIGLLSDEGEILEKSLEEIKKKCRERRWTKYGTQMNQHIYCECKSDD